MKPEDNVTPIRQRAGAAADQSAAIQDAMEQASRKGNHLGTAALFISLLAMILMGIFYYGVARNLNGLTAEVRTIGEVNAQLGDIDAKLAALEEKIATLDTLPQQAKAMVLQGMLQDAHQRLALISSEMDGESSAKLIQALKLMEEVNTELGK